MNTRTPLVPRWFAVMIAASLAVISFGLLAPQTAEEPAGEPVAAPLSDLVDAVWLDRLPEDAYTPFQLYIFSEEAGKIGINAKAESAFKILLETFEFIAIDTDIKFYFPHDRRNKTTKYKVEKMKKPTAYFDTMLTLEADPQNKDKKAVYYTGPELRNDVPGNGLPEHVRSAVTTLRQSL